jgi:uncharacterized protein (DUF1697 family)
MTDLKRVFTNLGYDSVRTLLQSGNVVFETTKKIGPTQVEALEAELIAVTGVRARMLVLPAARFLTIVAENPLLELADDPSFLVISFVDELPTTIDRPDAAALAPEVLVIGPDAVYQWSPLGVSKSRLSPKFWKQFGPANTTRNQRTVEKIAALLR